MFKIQALGVNKAELPHWKIHSIGHNTCKKPRANLIFTILRGKQHVSEIISSKKLSKLSTTQNLFRYIGQ